MKSRTEDVLRLMREGMSHVDISKKLGITTRAIRFIAAEHLLPEERAMFKKVKAANDRKDEARLLYSQGKSFEYIAKKLGVSVDTIYKMSLTGISQEEKENNAKKTDVLFGKGFSSQDIAKMTGISLSTIEGRRKSYKAREYTIVAPKDTEEDCEDAELWESMEKRSDRYINKSKNEGKATILMNYNEPIAIAFIGDTHIGNEGVDYRKLRTDAEVIAKTEGMHVMMGGDYLDNHILIEEAKINSTTSPKQQWKLYRHLHSIIGSKIMAAISGNHDYWTKRVSGLDLFENYYKNVKILYNSHYYLLTIKFPNGFKKVIKMRHKFRFNSSDNVLHSVKKMLKEGTDDYDIGVLLHLHQGDIEKYIYKGKERVALRTGTYLIKDTHADSKGYENSTSNMPCVIIDPIKNFLHIAWDIKEGAELLKNIRGGK